MPTRTRVLNDLEVLLADLNLLLLRAARGSLAPEHSALLRSMLEEVHSLREKIRTLRVLVEDPDPEHPD